MPALFDLGEGAKVVMLSVTEGDDKPLKYPHMFRAADVVIITRSDLLPHVDFSIEGCLGNMRAVDQELRPFRHHRRGGRCMARLAESRGIRRRAGIGIADLRTFPTRASNLIVIVPGFA
jgi:Ni2+-binding GTPase involved in maturation of urease and hydrogenase